jgi:hypothetical protein
MIFPRRKELQYAKADALLQVLVKEISCGKTFAPKNKKTAAKASLLLPP